MGKSVPVEYLDLGKYGIVIRQDFFWVIRLTGREKRIYVFDGQLMIFSSKEKAQSLIGDSIPENSTVEVMFWDEIVCFNPKFRKAVLDWGVNGLRICMDLDPGKDEKSIVEAKTKQ